MHFNPLQGKDCSVFILLNYKWRRWFVITDMRNITRIMQGPLIKPQGRKHAMFGQSLMWREAVMCSALPPIGGMGYYKARRNVLLDKCAYGTHASNCLCNRGCGPAVKLIQRYPHPRQSCSVPRASAALCSWYTRAHSSACPLCHYDFPSVGKDDPPPWLECGKLLLFLCKYNQPKYNVILHTCEEDKTHTTIINTLHSL